ncbi:MAG: hypothetical protein AB1Z23_03395 [Eubacteriales bacterium]
MDFYKHISYILKSLLYSAIAEGAEGIAAKSREQVPVQTGALRENCKIEIRDNMAEVLYDLPYAIEQHEDMEKKHQMGKAKYLEDAFEEECDGIVQRAAEGIARVAE